MLSKCYEPFLVLILSLAITAGVSHWKLQDGVIKAVAGRTIITDTEDAGFTGGDHVIVDKELYLLTSHIRRNEQQCTQNSCTKNKDSSSSSSRGKLKLKVTQHKVSSGSQRGSDASSKNCNDGGTPKMKSDVSKVCSKQNPPSSSSCSANRDTTSTLITCGEPVESTAYDFLEGVARRHELTTHPEPDVAMIFRKTAEDQSVDLTEVESLLRKLLKDNPNDPQILNQVGNLWRVKGHTQYAIECFRRALSISPNNPDILLNLGRVLYNLKFYDNTIFLIKLSLQQDQTHSETWLHHYTLGEAFKAVMNYPSAIYHFKKALEYNPTLHMAETHVREMERQNGVTNFYTAFIILTLASLVLILLYYFFCLIHVTTAEERLANE